MIDKKKTTLSSPSILSQAPPHPPPEARKGEGRIYLFFLEGEEEGSSYLSRSLPPRKPLEKEGKERGTGRWALLYYMLLSRRENEPKDQGMAAEDLRRGRNKRGKEGRVRDIGAALGF